MKVTYKEFEKYLKQEGYSVYEAMHLFGAIKSMDRQSRSWVLKWFDKGILPEVEVEGITASFLIKKCGYKPLNAFIILDWLKTDPQAAKYFVLKLPSTISPSESIGDEIEDYIDLKAEVSSKEIINAADILSD